MRGAMLLKVRASDRNVAPVLKAKISPFVITQMVGTTHIAAIELAVYRDFPVRFVGPQLSELEKRVLPRWQFGDSPVVIGDGVLFGANREGKAASAPLTAAQALAEIVWLPSLRDLEAQSGGPVDLPQE